MAKGIIYIMTTVVNGVVKIGKTGIDNFEDRMRQLENNGYANVVGLKREFAIQVEDYDEKEKLLGTIFSKSRLSNSELFAIDKDIVIQLLSSFDGLQIYPKNKDKDRVFEEATEKIEEKIKIENSSQKEFYITRKIRNYGEVYGIGYIKDGKFVVKKGSKCRGKFDKNAPLICENLKFKNGILQEDIYCDSVSTAGWIVLGKSNNGWNEWKTKDNEPLKKFRKNIDF